MTPPEVESPVPRGEPPPDLAVLLMAYGGPHSLDDLEPYLLDVRGGRPTPAPLVAEIRERYRVIGGRSPILERTREQAAALERRLNAALPAGAEGPRARVYVGMRHWFPYIAEAVEEIARDGARRALAIALAPQYSALSVGAYAKRLQEASSRAGRELQWRMVESWCDHPALAEAFARKLQDALERLPRELRAGAVVIFTAHSLPQRILADGDPYVDEVDRTVAAVVARLGHELEWRRAWQSAGQSGGAWLGPDASEVLRELAGAGRRAVVLAPVGFLCDHVEILYDVDVLYRDLARDLGLTFTRTESLNADPLLIEALADLVEQHEPLASRRPQPLSTRGPSVASSGA